jgi:DNA replication and repair protein RecF
VILTRLQLQHFRNYERLDLGLEPGNTVFYGPNGAGKTNIVEAIFTLATTKSFRARADREMIDRGLDPSELPFPFARLQGDAVYNHDGPVRVEILISVGDAGATGAGTTRKQFRLNGAARRAGDVVGQIKAVLFSPTDVDIVSGSPSARRRYVDLMLCQVDRSYLRLLQSYSRIVQQRNAVLTRLAGRSQSSVLEVWDEKLIEEGSEIVLRRIAMMSVLGGFARETYRNLSGDAETLDLSYVPSAGDLPVGSEADGQISATDVAEVFRAKLSSETKRAGGHRVTLVGPHRDDLSLTIDGASLVAYGSRGQHRTAALALRMAEARYIREQTGRQPILLLDEALAELDEARRDHLLRFVAGARQVILTGTSANVFDDEFRRSAVLVEVRDGRLGGR